MWEQIVRSFTQNPRDVKTIPLYKREALWFFVYAESGEVYVAPARTHTPSSKITTTRKLAVHENECETMLDLYRRRKCGEAVSKEAQAASVNQVYWYGIFADLGI
ncbi:MAG: hypothetical protein E7467_00270 [Ruminococcaceae bacterium]|nr:hypothetical protein [Oscillospiraceae bacterium]